MRRNGYARGGFTLSDLAIPVAILMLLTAGAAHYYSRHVQKSRQSQIEKAAREIFGDEADEVLEGVRKEAAQMVAENRVKTSGVRVASAEPEKPLPVRRHEGAEKPAVSTRRKSAPAGNAPVPENAKGAAPRAQAAAGGPEPGRAPKLRTTLGLANDYDSRCQAVMDSMYE